MHGPISQTQYVFKAWCLVKHRDYFTFNFTFKFVLIFIITSNIAQFLHLLEAPLAFGFTRKLSVSQSSPLKTEHIAHLFAAFYLSRRDKCGSVFLSQELQAYMNL